MARLQAALTFVSLALAGVAAGAVGLTVVANVVEVVARYAFNAPLNWGADFGAFALCATVFLALPEVTRRHAHTAMTLLLDRLPVASARVYQTVLFVLTGALCLVVAWFVGEVLATQYARGNLTSTANQIPRWWLTAVVFGGLVLSALNFVAFAGRSPLTLEAHAE